ncbi:MAG: hypothetical protein QXK37_06255 [Candidatus Woesearchaeota archaeon]
MVKRRFVSRWFYFFLIFLSILYNSSAQEVTATLEWNLSYIRAKEVTGYTPRQPIQVQMDWIIKQVDFTVSNMPEISYDAEVCIQLDRPNTNLPFYYSPAFSGSYSEVYCTSFRRENQNRWTLTINPDLFVPDMTRVDCFSKMELISGSVKKQFGLFKCKVHLSNKGVKMRALRFPYMDEKLKTTTTNVQGVTTETELVGYRSTIAQPLKVQKATLMVEFENNIDSGAADACLYWMDAQKREKERKCFPRQIFGPNYNSNTIIDVGWNIPPGEFIYGDCKMQQHYYEEAPPTEVSVGYQILDLFNTYYTEHKCAIYAYVQLNSSATAEQIFQNNGLVLQKEVNDYCNNRPDTTTCINRLCPGDCIRCRLDGIFGSITTRNQFYCDGDKTYYECVSDGSMYEHKNLCNALCSASEQCDMKEPGSNGCDMDCFYILCGNEKCQPGETKENCPQDCDRCTQGQMRECTDINGCRGVERCENGFFQPCTSVQHFCDIDCDGDLDCSDKECEPCSCLAGESRNCTTTNGCVGKQDCIVGRYGNCIMQEYFCDTDCDGDMECSSEICSLCECSESESRRCLTANRCSGMQICEDGHFGPCVSELNLCDTNCDGFDECAASCRVCNCTDGQTLSCTTPTGCVGEKVCKNGVFNDCQPKQYYCDTNCDGDYECVDSGCRACHCEEGAKADCLTNQGCLGERKCTNGEWGVCVPKQYYCDTNCDGRAECSNSACPSCNCTQSLMCTTQTGCSGRQDCTNGRLGECISVQSFCDTNCDGFQECAEQSQCKVCECNVSKPCLTKEGCEGTQECVNNRLGECKIKKYYCDKDCDGKKECSQTSCAPCQCISRWVCSKWGDCNNGTMTRLCTDENGCSNPKNVSETKRCGVIYPSAQLAQAPAQQNQSRQLNQTSYIKMECSERWQCSRWGECINGISSRTCTDTNNCGTRIMKPQESMPCLETTIDITKYFGDDQANVDITADRKNEGSEESDGVSVSSTKEDKEKNENGHFFATFLIILLVSGFLAGTMYGGYTILKKNRVKKSMKEYINTQLAKGYTKEYMYTYLINRGYPKKQVDELLHAKKGNKLQDIMKRL